MKCAMGNIYLHDNKPPQHEISMQLIEYYAVPFYIECAEWHANVKMFTVCVCSTFNRLIF